MEPVWILTASSVLMVALLIRAFVRGSRKRASGSGASSDHHETRYTVYLSDGRGFKNVTIIGTVNADNTITASPSPTSPTDDHQPIAPATDGETPDEVMLVLQQASGRQIRVRQSAVRLIQPS